MLNELLEDYQEFNEDEALDEFIKLLWNSNYGCRTYRKTYAFNLQPDLLNNNEDLIKLFEPYQKIVIKHAISYYNDKPNSIDMIRIHVNNMYMYLTNKEVYLSKEYFNSKIQPKKLYFKTIDRIKNGEKLDVNELMNTLINIESKTEEIRLRDIEKKIELSFKDYKKLINGYIYRIFNNYKSPCEYEQEHGWELNVTHDAWHEDNYVIKYFCKSLTGYMKNYKKESNKHIRCCIICKSVFDKKTNAKYCSKCKKEHWKKYNAMKQKEYRKKRV